LAGCVFRGQRYAAIAHVDEAAEPETSVTASTDNREAGAGDGVAIVINSGVGAFRIYRAVGNDLADCIAGEIVGDLNIGIVNVERASRERRDIRAALVGVFTVECEVVNEEPVVIGVVPDIAGIAAAGVILLLLALDAAGRAGGFLRGGEFLCEAAFVGGADPRGVRAVQERLRSVTCAKKRQNRDG